MSLQGLQMFHIIIYMTPSAMEHRISSMQLFDEPFVYVLTIPNHKPSKQVRFMQGAVLYLSTTNIPKPEWDNNKKMMAELWGGGEEDCEFAYFYFCINNFHGKN